MIFSEMKFGLTLLFAAAVVLASPPALQVFNQKWTVPDAGDWQVLKEGSEEILHMTKGREPLPGPRRPFQFALCDMPPAREVTLEADIRPLKRSVMIVYAYRDEAHFNYAHLSSDRAAIQPVHNGVFHVFGGERVRISAQDGPASFTAVNRWYHVKLSFNGAAGSVEVLVDNQPIPSLHAVDLSLTRGKVGLGSFNETGDFKNVKISAKS